MTRKAPLILGIDPGSRVVGYALVQPGEQRSGGFGARAVEYGALRSRRKRFERRLLELDEGLEDVLNRFSPRVLAIEKTFLARNPQSALRLGEARGIILLSAARRGLPVEEFSATEIKRAVTGNGQASKQQVQRMVQSLLALPELPSPPDVSDALATALCCLLRFNPAR